MTWYLAKDECDDRNSILAIIENEEVQNFLTPLVNIRHWIGLHDLDEEGQFYWVDGRSLDSTGFSNWQDGEPNEQGNGQDCVEMRNDGTWNDKNCVDIKWTDGYICQYDLEPDMSSSLEPTTISRLQTTVQHIDDTGDICTCDWNDGVTVVIVICCINSLLLLAILVYVALLHRGRRRDRHTYSTNDYSKDNLNQVKLDNVHVNAVYDNVLDNKLQ
ncbi:low affinity immunoglobulin epsilon Fc receptor-like [Saccoglossus kowalevskii]